jgi:hypothetical protein
MLRYRLHPDHDLCRAFSLAIALVYLLAETHVGEGKVLRGDPRQPKMRGSLG